MRMVLRRALERLDFAVREASNLAKWFERDFFVNKLKLHGLAPHEVTT
jgi:hypothetical protein